ncbi:5-formyltetrahydrofolate cyclo-ligase [Chthonobacter rhizosphaerae]|uniref:5-formyltetrahydrofolate cyclo-ligase n=1 Tax=Chthonobacter rhizosphaerae TaxID=2735553 RepID=UPI001AEE12EB|nr:5-formyltetrahydrofolate cyclo-ligase [Chthonobacter rhizosphaerae]
MADDGRWAGRNADKDRLRSAIWNRLVETGVNVGPVHSRIPNFAGADLAALHLSRAPGWATARIVKCNPDPPQIPVRLRALYDGKTVYAPVPELTAGFPYIKLDPADLAERGVDFELAATSQGYLIYGEPLEFEAMERIDFAVVGSVAVSRAGGRTGKGAGFADLETGIFRELGILDETTPLATTVHSLQLVDDAVLPMQAHDSALHYVATEMGLIATNTTHPQPKGVDWAMVQPDQFRDIPFLTALRARMEARS